MRFLLDVCASSRSLRAFLDALSHDSVSVVELNPSATDDEILEIGLTENRVLVTEDKDFGELIFVRERRRASYCNAGTSRQPRPGHGIGVNHHGPAQNTDSAVESRAG